MGRRPRVDRAQEQKWQILQEGFKSGNVSETCRRHGVAANLFYHWKDEAEQGRQGRAWGEIFASTPSRGRAELAIGSAARGSGFEAPRRSEHQIMMEGRN